MNLTSVHELLLHELADLLDAEQKLLKPLTKMAQAATNPKLRKGFEKHKKQTKEHAKRLERAFKELDEEPMTVSCKGIDGIIKEGQEILESGKAGSVLDAALIGAAQRVEHYEMAAYGTARAHAETMGHKSVAKLLQKTLDEEGATNEELTKLAEKVVNPSAYDENPAMA